MSGLLNTCRRLLCGGNVLSKFDSRRSIRPCNRRTSTVFVSLLPGSNQTKRHSVDDHSTRNWVSYYSATCLAVFTTAVLLASLSGCGGSGAAVTEPSFQRVDAKAGVSRITLSNQYQLTLPRPLETDTTFEFRTSDKTTVNLGIANTLPIGFELRSFPKLPEDKIVRLTVSHPSLGDGKPIGVAVTESTNLLPVTELVRSTANTCEIPFYVPNHSRLGSIPTFCLLLKLAEGDSSRGRTRGTPYGALFRFHRNNLGEDTLVPLVPGESLRSKRVAIVCHGIMNTAASEVSTAALVERASRSEGSSQTKLFDEVLIYDYDWTAGASENGVQLATELRKFDSQDSAGLWFFGHSNGGLVSRWAVERVGQIGPVQSITTFGTPHKGVPLGILNVLVLLIGLTDGLNDLVDGSGVIKTLDRNPSPYRNSLTFNTVVGNSDSYVVGGVNVAPKIRWMYGLPLYDWEGAVDGIVAGYSADPSNGSDIGRRHVLNSTSTLQKNHTDVARHSDVEIELRKFLWTTGSGVIR